MKIRAVMTAGLLLMLVGGCVEAPAADATGRSMYDQLCARCHGAELDGGIGPGVGPGSPSVEMSDAELATIIRDGRGRMPSLGGTLDDRQVDRVIEYMRERQQS